MATSTPMGTHFPGVWSLHFLGPVVLTLWRRRVGSRKGRNWGAPGLSQGPRLLPLVQACLADAPLKARWENNYEGSQALCGWRLPTIPQVPSSLFLLSFDFWFLTTIWVPLVLYWMLFAQQSLRMEVKTRFLMLPQTKFLISQARPFYGYRICMR